MRPAIVLVALAALGGCAFDDGDYFAELAPTLEASHNVPADRDAGDEWQSVGDGYAVSLATLSLEIHEIELIGITPAATGDDGHDHGHDHGEPEPEPDAEEPRVIVALPVGDVDVLSDGGPMALDCEPACGLPKADIETAAAHVEAIAITGVVRDDSGADRIAGEIAFGFDVELDEAEELRVLGAMELVSADELSHDVALALALETTPALLDGVEWTALTDAGDGFDLGADATARDTVLGAFAQLSLAADVTR